MALNFGILQPVNIGGQIIAGEQEAQRNQLAQQQLKTGAMQQEKAQMEMTGFKRRQAGLDVFLQESDANGKTGSPEAQTDSFYKFSLTQGNPELIMAAQKLQQAAKERSAYQASRTPGAPAAPAIAPAQELPGVTVGGPNPPNMLGAPPMPTANRLASAPVAPAAPVNQLGVDTNAMQTRIDELRSMYPNVKQAQDEADRLEKQVDESRKLFSVGGNLVTGTGEVRYKGQPAPTEISRLQAERAELIKAGVPLTDPRIQAYDQKLASGESQSAKLQRELQVAKANNAPLAVIAQIQRDIRNLHPGLAMQNVTGVDAQGNQIVTRFPGAGGGPQGQFGLNQMPTSTARAMLGLSEADSALLFGPGGPVELGQIPVGKLNASNAKMYVAAIKANPTLNLANLSEDQILQASKARAQGVAQGRQVLTLADRSTAQNIANGNIPPLTGPNSSKIMNEVIAIKPNYKSGDYGLQTSAVKAFNQGIQGNKVRSLNVVMEHFNTLEKAADALQSGDVRAINAVSQFIQTQTGKPAPANFNAVKEILADEIVASVVPGVGALADRVALKKTILASSSPEQLKGVVANYKELIGGQLTGLEKQYQAGTGRNDFKSRYLTPAAAQGLAPSSNQYIEIKNLPDGRKLGKKADGTVEEIK